jgi:hypothetical protein
MRAIRFIAAHVPVRERRDPLDPRSVPPLTPEDARRLIRATRYATKPETVLDDFEKGIVTPEGLRAVEAGLVPNFDAFREALIDHVTDRMLKNEQLSQAQRLNITKLLKFPAGADLKPAAIAKLQADFQKPDTGPSAPSPGPHRPFDMKIPQSGFDSVEARKSA